MMKQREMTEARRQELLDELQEHLPYAVQVKNPSGRGAAGEWMTDWDISVIHGKSAAHQLRMELEARHPHLQWRVIKKCDADMYQAGLAAGRRIADDTSSREPRRRHRPLRFVPDHL